MAAAVALVGNVIVGKEARAVLLAPRAQAERVRRLMAFAVGYRTHPSTRGVRPFIPPEPELARRAVVQREDELKTAAMLLLQELVDRSAPASTAQVAELTSPGCAGADGEQPPLGAYAAGNGSAVPFGAALASYVCATDEGLAGCGDSAAYAWCVLARKPAFGHEAALPALLARSAVRLGPGCAPNEAAFWLGAVGSSLMTHGGAERAISNGAAIVAGGFLERALGASAALARGGRLSDELLGALLNLLRGLLSMAALDAPRRALRRRRPTLAGALAGSGALRAVRGGGESVMALCAALDELACARPRRPTCSRARRARASAACARAATASGRSPG